MNSSKISGNNSVLLSSQVVYADRYNQLVDDISGIESSIPEEGFILQSPNGTRWMVTIDNDGLLIRTEI